MDTTDPLIQFNSDGVCNHCLNFDEVTAKRWFPNDEGKEQLELIFEKIRKEGKNKEYDCILGLSGGLDSAYLALVMKNANLRPLVVHVDAGWNSELAVYNIEKIVKYCNFELYTHVMDWDEVRDLQVSFLKAGVANQDVVQDHAYFSTLYHFATNNDIQYVINGGNFATESVFPNAWHHAAMDATSIKHIHKLFGTIPLKAYKTISFFQYYLFYPYFKKMKTVRPLNYMPYSKAVALTELKDKVGYKEYGRKHGESRFTKFFQNYYLPTKFGQDKRRPHFSSLILSGEMSREEALTQLKLPLYTPSELAEDKPYVAKKLGLQETELDDLISSKGHHYSEYKNWDGRYNMMKKIQSIIEKLLGRVVKNYS
jgi:N-acetyl sugar amidotransferase